MKSLKKCIALMLTGILMVLSLAGCGEKEEAQPKELHILAAASMTDVMTELGKAYEEEHPDVKLTFSFDSSGTLQTQIEEGAPADLFFSAATKQMDALAEQDLIDTDSVKNILKNEIVLIKPADSDLAITSFEEVVSSDQVEMVAIGNEDVPVGQYTQVLYENLNLWDGVKAKANYGTNVRQVLDWVATSNADCGIVYATDAATEEKVEIIATADQKLYDEAIYPAGIVKASEYPEETAAFLDYLLTDEAKAVFEKYQFTYIYE